MMDNDAALLETDPHELEATTEYVPGSALVVDATDQPDPVAPGMSIPFLRHWKVSGAVPTATTVKLAGIPSQMVASTGCSEIVGATRTTSVTIMLVVEPTG